VERPPDDRADRTILPAGQLEQPFPVSDVYKRGNVSPL
jgi:hypothetical protein